MPLVNGIPLARSGTQAQFDACINVEPLELGKTTDTLRTYVGSTLLGQPPWQATALAITAAGNSTAAMRTYRDRHQVKITLASGAYTYIYILPLTVACDAPNAATTVAPITGTTFTVTAVMPANSSAILEVRESTSGGTLKCKIYGDAAGGAKNWRLEFTFDGTAWFCSGATSFLP